MSGTPSWLSARAATGALAAASNRAVSAEAGIDDPAGPTVSATAFAALLPCANAEVSLPFSTIDEADATGPAVGIVT